MTELIDSVLFIGFGGPDSPDQIRPFLQRVTAGREVPESRLQQVEKEYLQVGGRSPYNELTERQKRGVELWLRETGRKLPVYLGMRNSAPFLTDVIKRMQEDGRRHAAGVILAPHRSQVSWERYKDDVSQAVESSGGHEPEVTYLEPWFAEPRFLEASAVRLEETGFTEDGEWPEDIPVIFTAHSIPEKMASASTYVDDVQASCRGVAELLEIQNWDLAYQSRSGNPATPWLEPDVSDVIRRRAEAGSKKIVVQAIGFLCDHVEVIFDLDVEAKKVAEELGVELIRAACVNDQPEFIAMLGERILQTAGRFS